ncbi:MAG: TetR/AcrR family transcriptional regulator [Dermatophilaceae bacterium]
MTTETAETGVRSRTRQAILDAAVTVLARRRNASLADIAGEARVGRTTVHRYFAERADLLDALSLDILGRIRAAHGRVRLEEGTGRDALVRLCRELFDLGDVLVVLMVAEPVLWERPEWQEEDEHQRAVLDAVRRGHADGSIDPDLSPEWVTEGLLWSMLYSGVTWSQGGEDRSRHDGLAMAVRSLDGALRPTT